ncbi:MAG: exonuclease SbcCD subunit D [Lachnospiraceae bacterium]
MRLLHTADWHLGKNLEGQSRLPEQERFLKDFVSQVEAQQVDMVLMAGDVYDNGNPPARAEQLFYDTLEQISKDGRRLSLVIAGNHDNPERLIAAERLAKSHGIILVGTPKTVVATGQYGCHEVYESGEGYLKIRFQHEDGSVEKVVVLTVPFPSEKRLNEVLYQGMGEEKEHLESYSQRMRQLFDELKVHFEEDSINLIISHLFVMESQESGSERSIQLGGSYLVDGSIFPEEAQYIALGHVHKPQMVPHCPRAYYSGSPIHYNVKEISFEKSMLLIEISTKMPFQLKKIPIPVYKPIEVWHCKGAAQAIDLCEKNRERNCWVYLEIETDSFIQEEDMKAMKAAKKDILSIRPIFSQKEHHETDKPMEEKSLSELFCEFYQAKRGVPVQEETLQLFMSLAQEYSENEDRENEPLS